MSATNSSLSINRNFWFRSYDIEYLLRSNLSQDNFTSLLKNTVAKLMPVEVTNLSPLLDLKGREPNSLIDPAIAASLKPDGFELFFVHGFKHALKDPDNEPEWDDQVEPVPFTFRINTPFLEFKGAHHIVHAISIERSECLARATSLDLISDLALEVRSFRLGLDLFKSNFTAMLGFTPTVKESLLLECDHKQLLLQINSEGLKERGSLPLSTDSRFDKLGQMLEAVLGFSIDDDYRVKSRL